MKQTTLHLITLLILALTTLSATAQDFEVDGIYYNINGTEATVTYRGTYSSDYNEYAGDVTIPENVTYGGTTYSVTAIGRGAFRSCSGLTSINIPNSVTAIGNYAFEGCSGLTSITIPNSVTSIGDYAFLGCSGLTSISVDSGNAKFDSRNNCNAIIETATNKLIAGCINTIIPNSVTAIGDYAFYRCSGLTSINIPNSVTAIGMYAFDGTAWFDNQPDGLVYAGLVAYKYKGTMPVGTSITLAEGTLGIAGNAFFGCYGLTSITIPNSVTSIGNSAFFGCNSLSNMIVENNNPIFDSRNNCNAIIETATNTLFAGCKNTIIPNSVTSIGGYAFSGYSGVTSITIPNSVTSIGNHAFLSCNSLANITIPNSVTSIGESAFMECTGLTSITIPNSVTSIGNSAFEYCTLLTSITIPNSVTSIGESVFYGCSELTSITIPNSVTSIGNSAFEYCTLLTSITIPNSVTSIGYYAFYSCRKLTNITIPNSVTSIGGGAFDGTAWFNNQPDGLVYAGLVAYKYKGIMPAGTNIVIAEGTRSIADHSFNGCIGLTSITIPNSVTAIGYDAFWGCSSLTSVNCLAITPPTITYNAFPSAVTNQASLYVPRGSVAAYQAADNWKDFSEIVGITVINDFEVDGVWYRAQEDNTATVVQKPSEGGLYQGDVVIPDSVSSQGYTFAVTAIDASAFEDCYELTSVVIGDAVETIGENAFQGCTGLTSVTIGSGVRAIGAKAFNYCNALTTVTCRGTVPPVMANANCFSNAAYSRATLLVPRQQIEAYQAADYWYRFSHIEGWGSAGMGDVNADGTVSISDVTALINALLTNSTDPTLLEFGDINHNGRLDIGDVTSLIVILLSH